MDKGKPVDRNEFRRMISDPSWEIQSSRVKSLKSNGFGQKKKLIKIKENKIRNTLDNF